MKNFDHLAADDLRTLTDAPALITILVGGADGNLDQAEIDWAHKLSEIRGYAHNESLRGYYDVVHHQFDSRIAALLAELPTELSEREASITSLLANINLVLPSLNEHVAYRLYKSLISFAEHIAKASGGILRFMSISNAEEHWLHLPMITPIALPHDLEPDHTDEA